MVDAQAVGAGQIGAQHFDEGPETALLQTKGREGRNAPVLSGAAENVGRRTNADRRQKFLLARPRLTAATVGANGQIGQQADLHASIVCRLAGPLQTAHGQPLRKGMEANLLAMPGSKLLHGSIVRIVVALRPAAPVRRLLLLHHEVLQGLEAAMLGEGLASLADEVIEVALQGFVLTGEVGMELAQKLNFQLRTCAPVDQVQGLQARHLLAKQTLLDGGDHGRLA